MTQMHGMGLRRAATIAGAGIVLLASLLSGSTAAFGAPQEVDPVPTPPAEQIEPAAPVDPAAPPPEPAAPAEPAAAPVAPQLSIAVSDDQDAAAPDDELSYTIVVHNLGTTDAFDLTVTQTVPEGLTFATADNGGTLNSSAVSWTVEVKAAESATLSTTMTVGATPDELLRVATVACALSGPADPPIVCASDSDILPAGVAAAEAAADASPGGDDSSPWIIGASIGGLLLIAAAVAILLRRRRRSVARS